MADTAHILVNLFNGARRPLNKSVRWMVRISDGRSLGERRTVTLNDQHGSSKLFEVPFFDNAIFDAYTVIVTPDGYEDGAWMPVHLTQQAPARVDLMVLPKQEELNFNRARW